MLTNTSEIGNTDNGLEQNLPFTDVALRIICDKEQNGAWNMAVDEALLQFLDAEKHPPIVRLYGFSPAVLSLGCFQPISQVKEAAANRGLSIIRRPTGGQAVLHQNELTYTFVVGKEHLERFSKRKVYAAVQKIIVRWLFDMGVTSMSGNDAGGRNIPPNCFHSSGIYELNDRWGRKLVGSAQMVKRHGIMQHGSIAINKGKKDIEAPDPEAETDIENPSGSIEESTGRVLSFNEVRQSVMNSLLRLYPHASEKALTKEEYNMAVDLYHKKYTSASWTEKY